MKHPSNCELYSYWDKQRGDRLAPERADIEPTAIRQVLGDTFVLAAEALTQHPFRLAGTRLCALFGRELKGESFIKIWDRADQAAIRQLLAVVLEEKTGVVASVAGSTMDDSVLTVNLELLLLPLAHQSRTEARVIGALAPMSAPYWLGAKAISPLKLGMFRHIGAAIETPETARLVAAAGRLKHGLVVYQGGRRD